jgi:hypothetical protein
MSEKLKRISDDILFEIKKARTTTDAYGISRIEVFNLVYDAVDAQLQADQLVLDSALKEKDSEIAQSKAVEQVITKEEPATVTSKHSESKTKKSGTVVKSDATDLISTFQPDALNNRVTMGDFEGKGETLKEAVTNLFRSLPYCEKFEVEDIKAFISNHPESEGKRLIQNIIG